jgi:hypothetical protein
MIRAYAGLFALDSLLLATGGCVLYGLGLIRDVRSGLRLSGLSFIVGWACYGVVASFALIVGLALTALESIGLCALVAVGASLLRSRIPTEQSPARSMAGASWLRWLGLAALSLLAVYLVAFLVRAFVAPADEFWDAWAFWLPKAKSIYYFGGLDTGPGAFTHFANRDYPPMLPGFDATAFHFMGGVHPAALPVQEWVLAASFFGAAGSLLTRRVNAGLVWPVLAMLAVMPRFSSNLLSAVADQPVAITLSLAAVFASLWLLEGDRRYAALCGIFLAASALLKNEGLLFGLFLVAALAVAIALQARARWRAVLILALVPLLAILPWKVWLAANGEPVWSPYYSFTDLLHPVGLVDRTDRLGTVVSELPQYVLAPHRWLLTVPLVFAAAALVLRRHPGLALLPTGFFILAFLGMSLIYWIGSIPIDFWIFTSAERVAVSLVVVPGVLLPLLLSEAMAEPASAYVFDPRQAARG